jgi:hypothetical protein
MFSHVLVFLQKKSGNPDIQSKARKTFSYGSLCGNIFAASSGGHVCGKDILMCLDDLLTTYRLIVIMFFNSEKGRKMFAKKKIAGQVFLAVS